MSAVSPDDLPPEDSGALSERERAVLDDIAGHENAADPAFVTQLRAPTPTAGAEPPSPLPALSPRARNLAVQAAVVLVVAAVLVPASWLATVALTVLLVGPAALAIVALRRGAAGGPAPHPPDDPGQRREN